MMGFILGGPGSEPQVRPWGEALPAEKVREVMRTIFHYCPNAVPESAPEPVAKACDYAGWFAQSSRQPKGVLRPMLYHRLGKIIDEFRSKATVSASAGKLPSSL